jgi:hypothetical protein
VRSEYQERGGGQNEMDELPMGGAEVIFDLLNNETKDSWMVRLLESLEEAGMVEI